MSQTSKLILEATVSTPNIATHCSSLETHRICESDEFCHSDESDHPSGVRWAPVGANDCDNDFIDESKCSRSMEASSYNIDRLKVLEEEQEILNSSLIALTTHFAQVQFRLRQIVDAPADEKEKLLKELEKFAFRGIPDVPGKLRHTSTSVTPASVASHQEKVKIMQKVVTHRKIGVSVHDTMKGLSAPPELVIRRDCGYPYHGKFE